MTQDIMLYQYIWFFTIYAFIGWCTEVIYATVNTGKFVNRGFLNGPVCPIYGFGTVILVYFLTPVKDNLIILFLGSVILTSLLEYITGFILEKLFHHKWWDYSGEPFNIQGYICLKFSLLWGLGCILIMKVIHPIINRFVMDIPKFFGYPLVLFILLIFIVDAYVTVVSIYGLNRKLDQLEDITIKIKELSDELGENISGRTHTILEKNEKLKIRFNELRLKQKEVLKERQLIHKRLIKAFPNMKSNRFYEALEKLKKHSK
ncbi:putative ABC transporter permease [Gottschalkia acidurici]|nr:putative ABC transporter permease [Gottschalkia acidurici]